MDNPGIGIRLRMVNNAVRRYIDRNTDMERINHITCSNDWIIGHLYMMENLGRDVYQRDFENDFGITRSTASKVLTLLEKKGLLTRVPASHDGRMKRIILTDASREMGREIKNRVKEMEERMKAGFTENELSTFYDYLDRILDNLSN